MRVLFLSLLAVLLLSAPALATEKCCTPRDDCAQQCQPRVEVCGGWDKACATADCTLRCAPPHQCPEYFTLCERTLCFCPPPHREPEFACLPCRTVCIPEPCHKPAVLITLLDSCADCGGCGDCR